MHQWSGKVPLRDFLIALSLVHLFHFSAWHDLNIAYGGQLNYYRNAAPRLTLLVSLILIEIALSAILAAVMMFVRLHGERRLTMLARWSFLAIVALSIDVTRRGLVESSGWFPYPKLTDAALLALELLILSGSVLLHFRVDLILRLSVRSLLALSPLIFVSTFDLISAMPSRAAFDVKPARGLSESHRPPVRIVCLIFDELDQRYCFDLRPSSVKMPELDRLRRQSLFASHAHASGSGTLLSLPSLISGRMVNAAEPAGENDLFLRFEASTSFERWSVQPNIFRDLSLLGFNMGLVGWYHPYARTFPGLFCRIAWRPNVDTTPLTRGLEYAASTGITASARHRLLQDLLFLPLPSAVDARLRLHLTIEEMDFLRRQNRDDFIWLRQQALQMLVDPRVSFLFMHLPIPHPLGIYNRYTDEITLDRSSNYFDNLELVDSTIRDFHNAMSKAGLWDNTVVLITSDHGFRRALWHPRPTWTVEEEALVILSREDHVPFLLKMANQLKGINFEGEFNTVIAHDLMLATGRGEIITVDDAAAWLWKNTAGTVASPNTTQATE